MKLYIKNLQNFNKTKLNQFYKNEKLYKMIYSLKGIFEINNDTIYKINICDEEVEKIKINEYECFLDKSAFKIGNIQTQIPYDHVVINIKKEIYKQHENSLVEFIVENVNNNVKDFYFNIKDNLHTHDITNEIYSFLSHINNRII